MGGIIWLASYPKSGNTWLRAFLTSFQRNDGQPVDINALAGGPIARARDILDESVGVKASALTHEEVEGYRPAVYRHLAARSSSTVFLKIHDAYTYTEGGVPLVPAEATCGAVYMLRHPFDVAVSFAHLGWPMPPSPWPRPAPSYTHSYARSCCLGAVTSSVGAMRLVSACTLCAMKTCSSGR
jgi:hypothetical protein